MTTRIRLNKLEKTFSINNNTIKLHDSLYNIETYSMSRNGSPGKVIVLEYGDAKVDDKESRRMFSLISPKLSMFSDNIQMSHSNYNEAGSEVMIYGDIDVELTE